MREKSDETPFQLRTLGDVALVDRGGRTVKLRTRKSLLLLACLAAEPEQAWTRDRLAALFWADRQDEQARNSLRTALSDIRRALGADALLIEGAAVALAGAAVSSDVQRLRALAASSTATDALATYYGGDFLAGADDGGAAGGWITTLRTACRDMAAAILTRATAALAAGGEPDMAILRGRELLSLDPLSETSHRTLMRLYADSGERSKAIAQFQSCRQMLQHELGVEPSAETRQLADDIAITSAAALTDLRQIATAVEGPARPALPGSDEGDDAVSIAVLPFVNMSGDADQDYFAEGVSEDIVTDLSKVADLTVAAAGATRPYRAANMRPDEIAVELGVRYILEGSVRRSARDVRITTSLIDGRTNRQVWAERYDRELGSVFDVQSEIAANVARAVEREVAPLDPGQAVARGTSNPQAHEHYLRGRALLQEMTRRSVESSRQSFERAVDIDPGYALAFAGIAEAISMLGYHYDVDKTILQSAIAFSHRALELDPGLAEAHCSLARCSASGRDFGTAEAAFRQALAISPNLQQAHYYSGLMFLETDRPDRAQAALQRAIDLGGRDLQTGMMLINAQQAQDARADMQATAAWLLKLARRRLSLNPYDDQAAYVGATALNALGEASEARRWANIAAAYDIDDSRASYNIACLFVVLGDRDRALRWLEKTLALGVPPRKRIWIQRHDSDWVPLREDAGFKALFAS